MLTVLHQNIDKLFIYQSISQPNGTGYFRIESTARKLLADGSMPSQLTRKIQLKGHGFTASYPDFDLRLSREPGKRFRIQVYFQPKSLHERPQDSWARAMDTVDALRLGLSGEFGTSIETEPWRIRDLHLHADVQGWSVGTSTAFRFVTNGTDVRTLVYRGEELQTIYASIMAVYNKTREIQAHPDKAYIQTFWAKYDPNEGDVWRIEFRLDSKDRLVIMPIDLDSIWVECLKRVRLPWGDGRGASPDGNWDRLIGLHFDPPWPRGFWDHLLPVAGAKRVLAGAPKTESVRSPVVVDTQQRPFDP